MKRLLDLRVRDVLREATGYLVVGTAFWLPVIVALVKAQP